MTQSRAYPEGPMQHEIFGRDDELRAIDRLLGEAPGERRMLLIEGPPGIGSTTIWQHALDRARDKGRRVLVARPKESDWGRTYSADECRQRIGDAGSGRLEYPHELLDSFDAEGLHRASESRRTG